MKLQSIQSLKWLNTYLQIIFSLLLMTSISACSPNANTDVDNGELIISLTDAEGDFITYTVDVVSLKMLKQDGTQIEALPLTTTLDFAQYIDVSEFLTAASVPAGTYLGAKIVLDYSNANITVQDENGDAINASSIDADGNAIGQLTVDINLNGDKDFVIKRGVSSHFTLDFDLDASNQVNITGDTAVVTVQPVLNADTILNAPKPHRLRGLIANVDEDNNQFTVAIRPFRQNQQRFGELLVNVDEGTTYEVNGTVYNSETGLSQLALLEDKSPIIVLGKLQLVDEQRRFVAQEILAGSSVPWGDKDIVRGHVVARNGDLLSIRGASIVRADKRFEFNDNISVQLNNDTTVVKQADAEGSFNIADISVGQRITISGIFVERDANAAEDVIPVLNASHVRLRFTKLNGQVTSVSPLAMSLQSIDGRRTAVFDFSGTGIDTENDADISNYEIDSRSLSLDNLQIGDPIRVQGFVQTFNSAPEDFIAQRIADVKNINANLVVGYGKGSPQAVSSIDANGLQLDLTDTGKLHHLVQAGIRLDLTSLDVMPLIAAKENGKGVFVISRGFEIQLFINYSVFEQALSDALANNRNVISVHAEGKYDADAAILTAKKINIRLSRK